MYIFQPVAAASPPHPNAKSRLPRDDCPRRSNRSPALIRWCSDFSPTFVAVASDYSLQVPSKCRASAEQVTCYA